MVLPDFLSADKFGYIHLTGHRVGLVDVLNFYQQGESAEMLSIRFPTVQLALLHRVIAHYLENQDEVDQYLRVHRASMTEARQASAGRGPSLHELKQRFAEQQVTGSCL